jgi:cell division septation protein DedD
VSGAANDVSNSHEPSYYEIALTNRQVVVAFVLLLLCLIAAFLSGVWIGRESGVRSATEQIVRNAPPPQEEKKEGQNLEEFEFFDSGQNSKPSKGGRKPAEPEPASTPAAAPPPPAPAAAQTGTDTTLAEDFGAGDTEAGAGSATPSPRPAAPAVTPKPAPAERVAQTKPPQEAPAGKPPKRTAEPASAEPARGAGQVVIQVFSSPEKDQAVRIRDRLVSGGHKAYLSPVEVGGRTMYRVRIGPFTARDKAQQVAEQVRKGYKLDTWVTE